MEPNNDSPDTNVQPTVTPTNPTVTPSNPTPAENPTPQVVVGGPGPEPSTETPVNASVNPASPTANSELNTPPVAPTPGAPIANPIATPGPNRSYKKLLIAAAAVVVIAGGSAAAYFGAVVPNKPENVLKSAINNFVQEDNINFDGTFNLEPAKTGEGIATKVAFKGGSDSQAKSASAKVDVTFSGATIGVETRYLDKNIYFKVDDLTPLATLAASYSPELAPIVQTAAKQLSNQWIVIDSTLTKQAGADCVLDTSWKLTKDDVKLLNSQYQKNPFTTITSTSTDTVGGKKVSKYELSLDDDKMAAYTKNLKDLSLFKSLKSCDSGKSASESLDTSGLADHDKTPLTLWIDKSSKQIVQVASHSTKQDETKDNIKGSLTIGLSYNKVTVTKPEGAKPALQVLTELQKSLPGGGAGLEELFGGGAGLDSSSTLLQ